MCILFISLCSKGKGSCKSYSDTSHPSDKGKGRGSTAVANGTARSHTSSRKSSGGSSQPQKKQTRVSFLYRYKSSSSSANAAAASSNPPMDEEREEQTFEPDPDVCINNNNNNDDTLIESVLHVEQKEQIREEKTMPGDMFPMETHPGFPESITANHMPHVHADGPVESRCSRRRDEEKRENLNTEVRTQIFI